MSDLILFTYAMALIGIIIIWIHHLNYKAHVQHEKTMRSLANGGNNE